MSREQRPQARPYPARTDLPSLDEQSGCVEWTETSRAPPVMAVAATGEETRPATRRGRPCLASGSSPRCWRTGEARLRRSLGDAAHRSLVLS